MSRPLPLPTPEPGARQPGLQAVPSEARAVMACARRGGRAGVPLAAAILAAVACLLLLPAQVLAANEPPAYLPATRPAGSHYLQVGAFHDAERAQALQAKISRMGFSAAIQQASIDDTGVYHRVQVGPFTRPDALARAKLKLFAIGIESLTLK